MRPCIKNKQKKLYDLVNSVVQQRPPPPIGGVGVSPPRQSGYHFVYHLRPYCVDQRLKCIYLFLNFCWIKPNFYFNYTFPIDLTPNGILFSIKSVGILLLQFTIKNSFQNWPGPNRVDWPRSWLPYLPLSPATALQPLCVRALPLCASRCCHPALGIPVTKTFYKLLCMQCDKRSLTRILIIKHMQYTTWL